MTANPVENYPLTSHESLSEQPESNYDILAKEWGVEDIRPIDVNVIELIQKSYYSDNEDDFDSLLEDVTTEFLSENCPQFHENIEIMRSRATEEVRRNIKTKQLALYARTKGVIADIAGLPTEASMSDMETSAARIRELLQNVRNKNGVDFDALATLGMVKKDDNGQEVFTFPRNIFPKSTERKWDMYIKAVRNHMKTANDFKIGLATTEDIARADNDRRVSHNSIAHDVKSLLGLQMSIEELRNLVSKMREERFPSVQSGEKARTNRALEEGLSVVHAIRHHLFPESDDLEDPSIFESRHHS